MYFSEKLALINTIVTGTDDSGDKVYSETTKTIFCDVKGIGMKEFYEADAKGLKPEIKFVIMKRKYSDQKDIIYKGKRYHVLRAYPLKGEQLEVICYSEVN